MPLEHLSLNAADRQIKELARSFRVSFGLDLNPPYQRGLVWSGDQKVSLIRSWLTGTPTGVVILNDRSTIEWKQANGYDPVDRDEPMYACIDGQQRISTACEWFDDKLVVPASWFAPEDVEAAVDTDDGPYVRHSGLTLPRRRHFANRAQLTVAVARVATVEEEAVIYLLVNGGGTPQTDADMANAARIARGAE
ncbi:DUF262 domain-containing protein [Streptomyces sp. NBC_01456]|uniref:DUF262 domain-containing protein n=1 Tax=unclassified Streptomyces TaxID=2593676 RepID=UPI002E2EAD49|nr:MULTISPECIES: DUF262 domain-containing protein [unclassified Streptomyces]